MRWDKKFLLIPLFFFASAMLSILYLQNVFFPLKFREIATQKAEELFHRRLTIKQVDYSFFQGFILSRVTLSEKDNPDKIFFTAAGLRIQAPLPLILKSKKIIIPFLEIKSPHLEITRFADKSFNFSDITAKLNTQNRDNKKSPPILLGGLSITQGEIVYTDKTVPESLKKTVQNINVKANLTLKASIDFSLEGQIPESVASFSSLAIKGRYSLMDWCKTRQFLPPKNGFGSKSFNASKAFFSGIPPKP